MLKIYRAKEFIKILEDDKSIEVFDIDLYLKMNEKMTVFDGENC